MDIVYKSADESKLCVSMIAECSLMHMHIIDLVTGYAYKIYLYYTKHTKYYLISLL